MDYISDQLGLPILRLQDAVKDYPTYVADGWDEAFTRPKEKRAFASPDSQEYPTHSPAAVWLGAAYAAAAPGYNIAVPEGTLEGLRKAAAIHGISQDVEAVIRIQTEAVAASTKSASTGEIYALSDGSVQFYPLGSAYAVSESAAGLAADFEQHRIPSKQARQAAQAIVKAASAYPAQAALIPDVVRKLGTPVALELDLIRKMATARDRAFATDLYSLSLEGLKEAHVKEGLDDLADIWRELDEFHGFKGATVTCPAIEDVFFAGTSIESLDKMAAAVIFINDLPMATTVFTSVPKDAVDGWFPDQEKRAKVQEFLTAAETDGTKAAHIFDEMDKDLSGRILNLFADYHAAK